MIKNLSESDKRDIYKYIDRVLKTPLTRNKIGKSGKKMQRQLNFKPIENAEPVAQFWRTMREKSNLSQKEFGKILGYRSGQIISNVERGMCGFPLRILPKACAVLGISKSEIKRVLLAELSAELDAHLNGTK